MQQDKEKKKLGIFVDDANMFYAQRKAGMRIDYTRLKNQLNQYFDVRFVNYHIVMPASWDKSYTASVSYKNTLPPFITVYEKLLKYIKVKNPDGTHSLQKKGDIDMELALDVLRNLDTLDAVLVLAGDSDYVALRNDVLHKGKKIAFASFDQTVSWEIKTGKYVSLSRFMSETQTPDLSAGRLLQEIWYSNVAVMSSNAGDKAKPNKRTP